MLRNLKTTAALVCVVAVSLFSTGNLKAIDINAGVAIYAEHCDRCHGPSGIGMAGMGELKPWGKLMKIDKELFDSIRDGSMLMPGYDGILTTDEILDVIAYMRTFQ